MLKETSELLKEYYGLDDETFDISHGKYGLSRTATYHKCTSKFDYSKIKGQTLTREGIGKEILWDYYRIGESTHMA